MKVFTNASSALVGLTVTIFATMVVDAQYLTALVSQATRRRTARSST